MSQKGREKNLYLSCCHFSGVSMRHDIVVSAFWKLCYALASVHGLQKVCVLQDGHIAKQSRQIRWNHSFQNRKYKSTLPCGGYVANQDQ